MNIKKITSYFSKKKLDQSISDKKVTCVYHSVDFDGFASAAIVKKKFPNAELIGWNHYEKIPKIDLESYVIICDIAFPPQKMKELAMERNGRLLWIDHHISSIKKMDDYFKDMYPFECYTKLGKAACELTWESMFPNKPLPKSIKLLSDYDVWNNQDSRNWNESVLPFQYGLKVICDSVEEFPYEILEKNDKLINNIISSGKSVLSYQKKQDFRMSKRSFVCQFMGYNTVCLNIRGSSNSFDNCYDPEVNDLMLTFIYNGKEYDCSLYTQKDNIDCSEIAKQLGGGGHKKAAGFSIKDIMINLKSLPLTSLTEAPIVKKKKKYKKKKKKVVEKD